MCLTQRQIYFYTPAMPLTLHTTHEILDVQDVASVLEVTRQRVHQLASNDDFPQPLGELNGGRVWSYDAIVTWNASSGRERGERARGSEAPAAVPRQGVRRVPDDVPPRDPNRRQNDPWDVDACQYLLRRLEQDNRLGRWSADGLLVAGRAQPTARRDLVEQAEEVFATYGVERRCDPGTTVIHFFRTDDDAPTQPQSAAERRAWRRHSH